jgi:hypothetical protein
VRIYTDYPVLAAALAAHPGFEVASEPSGIDALWTNTPLRDFRQLPPGLLVNQFPYEGCLVRKVRAAAAARADTLAADASRFDAGLAAADVSARGGARRLRRC